MVATSRSGVKWGGVRFPDPHAVNPEPCGNDLEAHIVAEDDGGAHVFSFVDVVSNAFEFSSQRGFQNLLSGCYNFVFRGRSSAG